jgi:hypothetical protein
MASKAAGRLVLQVEATRTAGPWPTWPDTRKGPQNTSQAQLLWVWHRSQLRIGADLYAHAKQAMGT